jgi:NAD(P)-dependent dehydrogenase (short-subunit alcohol dehydrogenase family)
MDLGVRGKGIVVVGGTSGMGLATAQVLAAEGASLVLAGRDRERAERAVASLPEGAGAAHAMTVDVRHEGAVDQLLREAVDALGRLDGIAVMTGLTGHEPMTVTDAVWTEVFEDVLLGTVRAVRAALPHLVDRGGSIVTPAAYSIRAPDAHRLPYSTLKSAVATFTKGVARTYGSQNVRANCIAPGAIETEGMHALRRMLADQRGWPFEEAIERVMVDEWHLDVALARPGKPIEVGELVAFLLSERAAYLTGALINIDGGTTF